MKTPKETTGVLDLASVGNGQMVHSYQCRWWEVGRGEGYSGTGWEDHGRSCVLGSVGDEEGSWQDLGQGVPVRSSSSEALFYSSLQPQVQPQGLEGPQYTCVNWADGGMDGWTEGSQYMCVNWVDGEMDGQSKGPQYTY